MATLSSEVTASLFPLPARKRPHVIRNSGKCQWYTPRWLVELAREVLGDIDLDPASCAEANETVRARRFYTAEDSGLLHPWAGRVWLNPPYNSKTIQQFVAKLCGHVEAGDVSAAILLTNNGTETAWFQRALATCERACFPKGRIRFGVASSPLQGQTLFYFGASPDKFKEVFLPHGTVCPGGIRRPTGGDEQRSLFA